MQIDIESFPIVWMRDHDEDEDHDVAADRMVMLALLERGEPFVLIAERMPTLADLAEMGAEERKQRVQMFKIHKADMTRLCAGMILIGRAASLPAAIRKPLEGLASAVGITLLFAVDQAMAVHLAHERLKTMRDGGAGAWS
ncbi:MAG: hypothetical protein RLQ73_18050 [Hoeflea sp. D1-CHI-28]|jgi:hypothetical protein